MKDFYKKLTEKLRAPETNQSLTDLKIGKIGTIDIYKSQYLIQEAFDVLKLPAVLMEYDINYESEKVTISLHCCWEQIRPTGTMTKQPHDSALLFFDFVNEVDKVVKTIETENTGKLDLISEAPAKDDAVIYVTILTYTASYKGKKIAPADKYDYTEANSDLQTDSTIVEKITEEDDETPVYQFD